MIPLTQDASLQDKSATMGFMVTWTSSVQISELCQLKITFTASLLPQYINEPLIHALVGFSLDLKRRLGIGTENSTLFFLPALGSFRWGHLYTSPGGPLKRWVYTAGMKSSSMRWCAILPTLVRCTNTVMTHIQPVVAADTKGAMLLNTLP